MKGRDASESGAWACLFIVGIGAFCSFFSTLVFVVTFLLFGGNCSDSFSTDLTGVGVSCTMLIVRCYGWLKSDGISTIVIRVVVTVMVMLDGVAGYGFSTLFDRWVVI